MVRLNLFDLFAKISLDTSDYDSGVKNAKKSASQLKSDVMKLAQTYKAQGMSMSDAMKKAYSEIDKSQYETADTSKKTSDQFSKNWDKTEKSISSLASTLKKWLASAGKAAAVGIGAITTAAGAAVGGLLALEQSTEEYRVAQGKLNTAFDAAGMSADAAQKAYNGFYEILGDTDTATEASQLLAQLADSAEDVSTWTDIAAGVNGTFGDSLPIEGLIEAANETANVGTVTGVLADALNWVGISEDEFNAKLAECSIESERNQLIMETLAAQYDEASDAFYRNNEALVASRNAQAQMDAVLSQLGETVSTVKNGLISKFLPAISNVATAFNGMLTGAEGADEAFATAVQGLVQKSVEQLPAFLNMGVQILASLASGIVQSIPTLVSAVPQIIAEIGAALAELLPQVLDMGVQLLDQLTSGIESGLPDMVSRIPQIITAFTKFVADNFPEIVAAGIDILLNLISGILSAIPDLVAALPQIMDAISEGIRNLMGGIVDVGKEIVRGIWDGITSMASWITDKVMGFFSGIVDGVKDFLGIHSPSRVFAGMGENMALGLGQGWGSEYDRIRRDIESGMNFGTASVDFASSGLGWSQSGLSRALDSVAATMGQNFTITVQSVLDGKVIGETAYQYSRNKQRAYGM